MEYGPGGKSNFPRQDVFDPALLTAIKAGRKGGKSAKQIAAETGAHVGEVEAAIEQHHL